MKHTVILPDRILSGLLADILLQHSRKDVEAFTEALIASLDAIDGDPDLEGECSEDEISRCTDDGCAIKSDGPGCEIGDPSGMIDEDGFNTLIGFTLDRGPGCQISDEGIADLGGFHD